MVFGERFLPYKLFENIIHNEIFPQAETSLNCQLTMDHYHNDVNDKWQALFRHVKIKKTLSPFYQKKYFWLKINVRHP